MSIRTEITLLVISNDFCVQQDYHILLSRSKWRKAFCKLLIWSKICFYKTKEKFLLFILFHSITKWNISARSSEFKMSYNLLKKQTMYVSKLCHPLRIYVWIKVLIWKSKIKSINFNSAVFGINRTKFALNRKSTVSYLIVSIWTSPLV